MCGKILKFGGGWQNIAHFFVGGGTAAAAHWILRAYGAGYSCFNIAVKSSCRAIFSQNANKLNNPFPSDC